LARLPELLLPRLLELLGLEGLLLELLGLLEGGLLLDLGGLEVGGQGVDLAVLVLVPGEAVEGDVLPRQLGHRLQGGGARGGGLLGLLGKLLGGKLLLGSKLLLPPWLLRSKLLDLLLLRSKLLLLLGSKLLLPLRSKLLLLPAVLELLELGLKSRPLGLLLLLGSKLLLLLLGSELLLLLLGSELLLLLELVEVLVEVLLVELVSSGLVWVELGSVEHWAPGVGVPLVGEVTPLLSVIPLVGDLLLPLHDTSLVGEHGLVPLPLQLELRARGDGDGGCGGDGRGGGTNTHGVRCEAGGVVGRVLDNHKLPDVVQVTVLSLNISLLIPRLQFEGSVSGLEADSVCSIFINLVDLLDDDCRVGGAGLDGGLGDSGGLGDNGGLCDGDRRLGYGLGGDLNLLAALSGLL